MAIMADVAEAIPMREYNGSGVISSKAKPDGTFVTESDLLTEQALTERLLSLLPNSAVLGEETEDARGDWRAFLSQHDLVWIVDPIDGTYYFRRKQPFGMLVGLKEGSQMAFAVAYFPVTREFLIASKEMATSYACLNRDGVLSTPILLQQRLGSFADTELFYYVHGVEPGKAENILAPLYDPSNPEHFKAGHFSYCGSIILLDILQSGNKAYFYLGLGRPGSPWDFHGTMNVLAERAGFTVCDIDGNPIDLEKQTDSVIFAPSREASKAIRSSLKKILPALGADRFQI